MTMSLTVVRAVLVATISFHSTLAIAQQHSHRGGSPLSEAGQGAFAAIAEVVARLESNPNTEWSQVDISELREHLVDMNQLILFTTADSTPLPNGLEARITASGRALTAAQRMVPAHAAQLDLREGWTAEGSAGVTGATLRVTAESKADVAMIQVLGFYGLMALEQHHQAHHWKIASGQNPHRHN